MVTAEPGDFVIGLRNRYPIGQPVLRDRGDFGADLFDRAQGAANQSQTTNPAAPTAIGSPTIRTRLIDQRMS